MVTNRSGLTLMRWSFRPREFTLFDQPDRPRNYLPTPTLAKNSMFNNNLNNSSMQCFGPRVTSHRPGRIQTYSSNNPGTGNKLPLVVKPGVIFLGLPRLYFCIRSCLVPPAQISLLSLSSPGFCVRLAKSAVLTKAYSTETFRFCIHSVLVNAEKQQQQKQNCSLSYKIVNVSRLWKEGYA